MRDFRCIRKSVEGSLRICPLRRLIIDPGLHFILYASGALTPLRTLYSAPPGSPSADPFSPFSFWQKSVDERLAFGHPMTSVLRFLSESPSLGLPQFKLRCRLRSLGILFIALAGASSHGKTIIDVMIAYTATVEDRYGNEDGVLAHALASLSSANYAFETSEVDVELNLVHIVKVDYQENPHAMGIDLDHMAEADGVMDELLNLRTEMGADLVCLFRGEMESDTVGIAYLLADSSGDKTTGFSVVVARYSMSGYVFQHEIGHNLGAAHDRDNAPTQGLFDYSYGYRYKNANQGDVRTLMAYEPGGQLNQFSNPNILVEGLVTGVPQGAPNAADNASTVAFAAPIVSDYHPTIARPPIVDAGKDVLVPDNGGDGVETVSLRGKVLIPYSDIVSWTWTWEGGSLSGQSIETTLPVGETIFTLTVEDALGRTDTDTVTVKILGFVPIKDISSGLNYSLILDDAGILKGFGTDVVGSVEGSVLAENVKTADAGFGHLLLVTNDGNLWGVGSNFYGALGLGSDSKTYETPIKLTLSSVANVAVGSENSLVLLDDGSLWAMGRNRDGQLGVGNRNEVRVPTRIVDGGVQAMAVGYTHALFVKDDGSLWGMGSNEEGALGIGDPGQVGSQLVPVMIAPSGFASVSLGDWSSFALKADGSLWAFGRNEFGQLGDGTNLSRWLPIQIVSGGVVQVDAGNLHTVFLKGDGSVWTMGYNRQGQLGEGTVGSRRTPKRIIFGGAVDITAGSTHSLFLRSNGSVWGAGANNYGQLPYGAYDFESHPLPEEVIASPVTPIPIAPTAVAGPDIERNDTFSDGQEFVRLDGSRSTDDWAIASWEWSWDGGSHVGPVANLPFAIGETVVTLTVTDHMGLTSTSDITIRVVNEEFLHREWLENYFDEPTIESFGSNLFQSDPDFDGLPNYWEWQLELDPSDSTSRIVMSTQWDNGTLSLVAVPYVSGLEYTLMSWTVSEGWAPSGIDYAINESALVFQDIPMNALCRIRVSSN